MALARQRVEGLRIPHAGSAVGPFLTLSVGVAHAAGCDAIDEDQLFAVADRALYEAKVRRDTTVIGESLAARVQPAPELQLLRVD